MLNICGKGKPIAIIRGGKYNGERVYIDDDLKREGTNEICLKDYDGHFQPVANPKVNRTVHYITGPSGSGKTFWIKNFLRQLSREKSKKEIYMISPFEDDISIDDVKFNRLRVDDICENPINWKDFDDCIVIFDDMDIFEKKVKEALYTLLEQLLKGGRHFNTDVFVTMHEPTGRNLQNILNESHTVTYFPFSGCKRKNLYLVENYCNLDQETFLKIRKCRSRWCTIGKNHPMYIITDQHLFTLDDDDDDDEPEKKPKKNKNWQLNWQIHWQICCAFHTNIFMQYICINDCSKY